MSIVVITDFDGVGSLEDVTQSAKLLRMHRHSLAFVVPDATTFAREPASEIEKDVFGVYARSERRHYAEAKKALAPYGVPVVRATAKDSPGLVIVQAQHATRRRAA